jgi:hypothetical protein
MTCSYLCTSPHTTTQYFTIYKYILAVDVVGEFIIKLWEKCELEVMGMGVFISTPNCSFK